MYDLTKAYSLILIAFLPISNMVYAQKFKSTSSSIKFFSEAPMEDIEAYNVDGKSAFDMANGEIVFSVPINSFEFEKSLMQEHFKENYLESDKYPNATFRGTISNYKTNTIEMQKAKATGVMTIHGVDQDILVEGELLLNNSEVEIHAKFPIKLEEYKIKIPKVVFYNIAEIVEVTIRFNYEKVD